MLYFLYGQDAFRAKQRLQEIVAQARQKSPELEVRSVDFPSQEYSRLQGELASYGLFSARTLWVLKFVFEARSDALKGLLEFLQKAPERFSAIIYHPRGLAVSNLPKTHGELYRFLKNKAYSEEFKGLKGREFFHWASRFAQSQGIKIEPQALQLLTSNLEGGSWAVALELEKLAAFKNGQPITLEAVRELTSLTIDPVIFDLLDAIGNQRPGAALYYLELALARPQVLLGGQSAAEAGQKQEHEQSLPFYLVAMLAYALRNLLQVKELQEQGKSPGELQAQLKLHPFVLQKTLQQARNFELKQLKALFSRLLALEAELKKSPVPQPVLLQEFVAQAAT